ncbi:MULTISPECIES: glycosyltransferase family 4 protein [unclassified Thioalkalivibrio]|uniref:glycosyltransferase family 4 protein n=1 Tax=unclassified Thioalkalivibrio TaxID=2621013 RepID=UPI00035C28FC|nr:MULTISPECIES: glycosyltransferase family 4 protein [unclassified Thioalkalivibrio]
MPELGFVVPGALDQPTGGYRYDAHMIAGLREQGWQVELRELEGQFPGPDARGELALEEALAGFPDGMRVLVDGLAAGAHPATLRHHAGRLRLVYLMHHPLGLEAGLTPARSQELLEAERAAVALAERVVVTSDYTRAQVADWGVPPERLCSIPPGVEPASLALGPKDGVPVLLCVAAWVPRKGQLELVRALSGLRDRSWRAELAGAMDRDRDYTAAVRAAIAEGGLEARISTPGVLTHEGLAGLYDQASIFVLPSAYEGFGMAFTEAMMRGLPVIGTTGGAIPRTVPEPAGLLVPPGNVEALRRALEGLLYDPEQRRRMGRAGRAHAESLPDWAEGTRRLAQWLGKH